MKKLILLLTIMLSINLSAQDKVVVTTTPELSEISSVEQTVVYYTKEFIEGTKDIGAATIDLVDQGISMVIAEGTAIVKQYLIYTSISYGIPTLIGLVLVFFLTRRIFSLFTVNEIESLIFNEQIEKAKAEKEEKKEPAWKKLHNIKDKHINFLNNYYKSYKDIVLAYFISTITFCVGLGLLVNYAMLFIKVTFFPKLYLAELVIKYLTIYG